MNCIEASAVDQLRVPPGIICDPLLNLVHDIRQPLSTIENIAALLELRLPEHMVEARRYIAQLQACVQAADVCLRDAVEASRIKKAAA